MTIGASSMRSKARRPNARRSARCHPDRTPGPRSLAADGPALTLHGGFMALEWTHSVDSLDWNELSELYRIAPLGNKSADWLKTAYSNSMFRCIAHDGGRIVAAGRAVADGVDCSYICDVVVHPELQGSG